MGKITHATVAAGTDAGTGEIHKAEWNASHTIIESGSEFDASTLTNATSTGDSGSRADHFPGTSLGGAWSQEANAFTAGPTVKYSVVGAKGSGSTSLLTQAYTPSGACRVETCVRSGVGFGFGLKTSTSGDAGDGVMIWYGSSTFEDYTLDSSSYNLRATASGAPPYQGWLYLGIERNGSNQWTFQVSQDRAFWTTIESGRSKTFTVAKIYLKFTGLASVDFVDVVS